MSLMVHAKLDDVYKLVCSRHFIYKIFQLADKSTIVKHSSENISFKRMYNHKDLDMVKGIVEIPSGIINIIESNLTNVNIIFDSTHEVIKHTDNIFIIKYISVLKEPSYIYQIIGNTKVILYVQFTINKNDPNMTVVHFNKKFVNALEQDDDSVILNASNSDIITNIYQQDKLHINDNLIRLSETILGHDLIQNIIIPTINGLFNTIFSILQDVYTIRFIKYMTKKGIEIYKKK